MASTRTGFISLRRVRSPAFQVEVGQDADGGQRKLALKPPHGRQPERLRTLRTRTAVSIVLSPPTPQVKNKDVGFNGPQ